jgi:hypothetical protein
MTRKREERKKGRKEERKKERKKIIYGIKEVKG